ncbi:hypothetical protein K443DRAFT_296260 [Laccaria amethystina LaAM-08-1]|uniref:Uncharacterized protein n=1 Tax=Laccaria amethystina LaAM-08-1 TaxID=1095629 RepID=A0A0C9WUT1_9AGAR|nr:hypothetical protein K443DRAFT_296260 [Laccaria amethystina LaAM-08-1]
MSLLVELSWESSRLKSVIELILKVPRSIRGAPIFHPTNDDFHTFEQPILTRVVKESRSVGPRNTFPGIAPLIYDSHRCSFLVRISEIAGHHHRLPRPGMVS